VVAHQAQRTYPGEDTPLQRSNGRVCCVRGVICNDGVPFRLHRGSVVNAQRVFVPRDLDLWPLILTFKLLRAKDQTRLPCEFGANPFSGSCYPLSNASLKNRTRFDDFAHLCIIGRQTITVNSGVSGPTFVRFLYDVGRTSALLTRPSAFPSCHRLWNASPEKEGVSPISADFAPKIGCHDNVPWPIGKSIPDWTSTPTCLPLLKI